MADVIRPNIRNRLLIFLNLTARQQRLELLEVQNWCDNNLKINNQSENSSPKSRFTRIN
jgi:hypothetical protein